MKLEESDMKVLGTGFAAKLFKLYQVSIEYDLYIVKSTEDIQRKYKNEYKEAKSQFKILEREAQENEVYINRLNHELTIKQKALERFKAEVQKHKANILLPDCIT